MTGDSEKLLIKNNISYTKIYVHGASHSEYYPEAFPLTIKLLFAPDTGKILGAQAIGMEGVDKRIDVIATAIKFEKTIYDLVNLELSYAPPFGAAKDPVNMAGMVAENVLAGHIKPVYWNEIEDLSEDTYLLDVRTEVERAIGKLDGSYNIPIEELRSRINEVPKDKKVVVYCAKGLKSYFAARMLMQNGYENIYSLSGGYLLFKQVIWDKNNKTRKPVSCKRENVNISNSIKIDACGLQCPGPIMKLATVLKDVKEGEVVEVKATDPGFKMDVLAWCNSTGNEFLCVETENKITKAFIKKGTGCCVSNQVVTKNDGQTIIVFSNDLDKAMASFILANAAAAAGKKTTMFFTFWGLNVLRKSNSVKVKKSIIDKMFALMMPKGATKLALSKMHMFGMGSAMMKYVMKSKNIPSLPELIEMAKNNGIKIIACNMAMDVMGMHPEELIDGIEFGGAATYIDEASKAGSNLFI
jgi:peroxiredoxin family protein/TusA-related sulfurtransferase/rhodanese-related sulfurtransferase